ncbi:MAG: glycine--tRNA ligase subunit beta [Deltaproteobacteria bacterium]|nr:glycine--tRNA ligase subunit beta [Deltaproteobacteria bacterium]
MAEFLLEIGTEEIPSGYIEDGLRQLRELTGERLREERVEVGEELETYGTPRRLVLVGRAVGSRQPDTVQEVTGPPVKAAYDADGRPTRAAEGFAKKQGVALEELGTVDTPKGAYFYVRKEISGRPAAEVLAGLLPGVIRDLSWPKSMTWGSVGFPFARPIHWVVALLDGTVVPFEVAGVASGRTSRGHRFMAPEPFEVRGVEDYLERLPGARVMVDPEERKAEVVRLAREAAASVSGEAVLDPDLVATVANLVETPSAVCGGFDRGFLELPDPVIITPMAEHQRYFAVRDGDGRLMPHFVAVNNTLARDPDVVRKGHERVLRARLSDADFFFAEDRKRPLVDRLKDLESVIYQAELGTSYEKVLRFTRIAEHVAAETVPDLVDDVRLAARLAKCDLVTEMVGEFASLQGTMGEVYARMDGHPDEVCRAVREHYLPVRSGGELPETAVGAVVGVADRLDTIAGCFAIGQEPSGAADPFALRRHALAILRILEDRGWDLSLRDLVAHALEGLEGKAAFDAGETAERVLAFFKERYRNRLLQEGHGQDAIEAVLSARFDRIPRLRSAIEQLERFMETSEESESLVLAFKRVTNILKKQPERCEVDPGLFRKECERVLWQACQDMEAELLGLVEAGDDCEALNRMADLRKPVDAFFEGVEVLTREDERVRRNRVGVLQHVSRLFLQVADFSRFR